LNETNQPPPLVVATNSGSLGTPGTGFTFDGVLTGQPGIVGNSYRFSNPNLTVTLLGSHVDVPYNPALNPNGPFTVELWVKAAQLTTDFFCPACSLDASENNANSRNGWILYQTSANQWEFRVGGTSGYVATLDGGSIQTNVWNYIVGEYDGANATLYVNGVQVAGPTSASGFSPNATMAFRLGATTIPNRTYDGWVDEVAFYTNVLSASVISAHYNAATTNNSGYAAQILTANPLGYWRLDNPPTAVPTTGPLPVAVNFGTLAPNGNGTYEPGSMPGVPGVPKAGFGPTNFACTFGGTSYIDVRKLSSM